jgi:hypothetical protein
MDDDADDDAGQHDDDAGQYLTVVVPPGSKNAPFRSTFPMFVPSLSWQNIVFVNELLKKRVFRRFERR